MSWVTLVVMAKPAVAGRVKTRMCPPLTSQQAAELHAAMSQCLLDRVATHFATNEQRSRFTLKLSLAMNADHSDRSETIEPGPRWRVVGQGGGDLGDRLKHVWTMVGGGPVVFLGTDSPDLPLDALSQVVEDVAAAGAGGDDLMGAGPVDDGGYWVVAGSRYDPGLLSGIDWGTETVYDQTRQRAAAAGVNWREWPRWHDVDDRQDLAALIRRLDRPERPERPEQSSDAADPTLARLKEQLQAWDLPLGDDASHDPGPSR